MNEPSQFDRTQMINEDIVMEQIGVRQVGHLAELICKAIDEAYDADQIVMAVERIMVAAKAKLEEIQKSNRNSIDEMYQQINLIDELMGRYFQR